MTSVSELFLEEQKTDEMNSFPNGLFDLNIDKLILTGIKTTRNIFCSHTNFDRIDHFWKRTKKQFDEWGPLATKPFNLDRQALAYLKLNKITIIFLCVFVFNSIMLNYNKNSIICSLNICNDYNAQVEL
jgi:hypothetical protein